MRGAPVDHDRILRSLGIIPAYAGSTWHVGRWRTRKEDHPRVCGEHPRPVPVVIVVRGSSPRMRGAPSSQAPNSSIKGIIPAYAGSTRSESRQA